MATLWSKDQKELKAAKKEVLQASISIARARQIYAGKLAKLTTIELRIRDRQQYNVY